MVSVVKCVIVGDSYVGKTCLLTTYASDKFPYGQQLPTPLSVNHITVQVTLQENEYVLYFHDTPGVDDYDRVRPLTYPNTDVFIVCFSEVNPSSFNNVMAKWVPEITQRTLGVPFLFVGTKTDLRDDPVILEELAKKKVIPVSVKQGEELAKKLKAAKYVECSALTQKGLINVFREAISKAMEHKPIKTRKFVLF